MNDFSEKLKILRTRELKITQRDMSLKLDLPLRTYEAYERGEHPIPNVNELFSSQEWSRYEIQIRPTKT